MGHHRRRYERALAAGLLWIGRDGGRVSGGARAADRDARSLGAVRAGVAPGGPSRIDSTHTVREDVDDLPAIGSALPHTRCLHTLELSWLEFDSDNRIGRYIVWLGYALFNPDAASSTWRRLICEHKYYGWVPDDARPALHLMAQGNNLAVVLGFSRVVVDAYYCVTIRAGARILKHKHEYAPPSKYWEAFMKSKEDIRQWTGTGDSYDDNYMAEDYEESYEDAVGEGVESVLMVLEEATRMDACMTSTDLGSLDEYVFVIVPGYGNAWVHCRSIERIESRPPGRSSLTALRVHQDWEMHEVRTLVQVVRESLESLRLEFGVDYAEVMA